MSNPLSLSFKLRGDPNVNTYIDTEEVSYEAISVYHWIEGYISSKKVVTVTDHRGKEKKIDQLSFTGASIIDLAISEVDLTGCVVKVDISCFRPSFVYANGRSDAVQFENRGRDCITITEIVVSGLPIRLTEDHDCRLVLWFE